MKKEQCPMSGRMSQCASTETCFHLRKQKHRIGNMKCHLEIWESRFEKGITPEEQIAPECSCDMEARLSDFIAHNENYINCHDKWCEGGKCIMDTASLKDFIRNELSFAHIGYMKDLEKIEGEIEKFILLVREKSVNDDMFAGYSNALFIVHKVFDNEKV